MATKKLQRTVIEGGRYTYNKWSRRQSSAEERAEARDYCKKVTNNPELADEYDIDERRHIGKGFTDKLSPMYRWLDAQVGRPWNEVRSEVFEKFDTRTLAGRHITFDHLLRSINEAPNGFDNRGHLVDPEENDQLGDHGFRYYRHDYYVDKFGFLQKGEYKRSKYVAIKSEQLEEIEKFLNGRMIVDRGGKLYWLMANDGIWAASWFELNKQYNYKAITYPLQLRYYLLTVGEYKTSFFSEKFNIYIEEKKHGNHWEYVENPFSFRQRGELTKEEIQYYRQLPLTLQKDIIQFSKGR